LRGNVEHVKHPGHEHPARALDDDDICARWGWS
jgi:hypothetical protein